MSEVPLLGKKIKDFIKDLKATAIGDGWEAVGKSRPSEWRVDSNWLQLKPELFSL